MSGKLDRVAAFLATILAFTPTVQARWHPGVYLGPPIYGPYGPYYPGYSGYYPGPYPGFFYPGYADPGLYPGWNYHHHKFHYGQGHTKGETKRLRQ
jgi:hypothetical protein